MAEIEEPTGAAPGDLDRAERGREAEKERKKDSGDLRRLSFSSCKIVWQTLIFRLLCNIFKKKKLFNSPGL